MTDQSDPLCLVNAERQVLGAVLLDPRRLFEAADVLDDGSFSDPRCRATWQAMCRLGAKLDLTGLRVEAARAFGDDTDTWLISLGSEVTTTAHLPHNVKLLERAQRLRVLRQEAQRLVNDVGSVRIALDGECESFVEDAIDAVKRAAIARQDIATVRPAFEPAVEAVEQWARPYEMRGSETGIGKLDRILGGVDKTNMLVVGARPGRGKTSLAIQLMLNAAQAGLSCLFLTMEMSDEQIMARCVANMTELELNRARSGGLTEQEIDVARYTARETVRALPMRIAVPRKRDIKTIRQIVRTERGVDFVFLDYLQLLTGDGKQKRFEYVGAASTECKALAMEFDTRMVVLSQLAREAETEKPKLSHMRESGNIEQDANQIVLLSFAGEPDAKPDFKQPVCQVTADVAKNRDGCTGEALLTWNRACGRYDGAMTAVETIWG